MARGRSSSRSRSERRDRSPSEFRSMTRSRSRSGSVRSRSTSRDRGRPLRSKYARSSSRERSPSRPKHNQNFEKSSRSNFPSVDLTRGSHAPEQASSSVNPGDGFSHPPFTNPPLGQAGAPVPEGNPIQTVSQMRFQPPPNNYQDFPSYGPPFFPAGNPGYHGGLQLDPSIVPPGPNYDNQQVSGGRWNEYPAVPDVGRPPPHANFPGAGGPSGASSDASKKSAVENELAQQKKKLAIEREGYFKQRVGLTKDFKQLKEYIESLNDESDSARLKESLKLQEGLLQKLKSIDSVIDMLTQIIGDREQISDILKEFELAVELPKKSKSDKRRRSKSRSRSRSRSRSKSHKKRSKKSATPEAKMNIVHYDPELHWCSTCNVFPRSALAYLMHLHTDTHKLAVAGKKSKDKPDEEFQPWRIHERREPSPPKYKNAPSKRVPIRGVPFLVPATAWYCSLCKTWLGDMEHADRHLKGPKHASMYTEFMSQNPHWEVDWLRDRTRAYEKNSEARAKEEETSMSREKKNPSGQDIPDLGKLTEMLANVRKKATAIGSKHRDSSKSSSSGSDYSEEEEKKKKSKKKGKNKKKSGGDKKKHSDHESGDDKKKKKKKGMQSRDKSVDTDDDRKSVPRKDGSIDRKFNSGRRDQRNLRFQERGRYHRGFRGFRGGFRGRFNRGGHSYRQHDNRRRSSSREDRDSPDRHSRKKKADSDEGSHRSSEERSQPMAATPGPAKPPNRPVGKQLGLGGAGIARLKFNERKILFQRPEDQPNDLYGPLEPPKKD